MYLNRFAILSDLSDIDNVDEVNMSSPKKFFDLSSVLPKLPDLDNQDLIIDEDEFNSNKTKINILTKINIVQRYKIGKSTIKDDSIIFHIRPHKPNNFNTTWIKVIKNNNNNDNDMFSLEYSDGASSLERYNFDQVCEKINFYINYYC